MRKSGKGSGEDHYCAKLTWEKVREIRKLAAARVNGKPSNGTLAEKFGVSAVMIHKIVKNKAWFVENDPAFVR